VGASSRLRLALFAAWAIAGLATANAAAHMTPASGWTANLAAGTNGSGTASAASFYAPGPLACEMDDPAKIAFQGVSCQTLRSRDNLTVRLKADGTVIGCMTHGTGDSGARCDLGNVGMNTPTFSVGQQATVGPFVCQVLATGVQCTIIATGKGFLMTANSLTGVGGASVLNAPYHLPEFLSPDHRVWCGISAPPLPTFCAAGKPSVANPPQHSAQLKGNGAVTVCSVPHPTFRHLCLQNWDSQAPVLRLGQQSELDGVLCTSARNGITCVLEAPSRHAGTGFRVTSTSAVRIVGCLSCATLRPARPERDWADPHRSPGIEALSGWISPRTRRAASW
jgi:hypothetical protein